MADQEPNLPIKWWDHLLDGGLPQVLAGPAGAALSRLVAGVTDIPAAWLDSYAQRIRDETDARSLISKRIAQAAGQVASFDQDLVDRTLVRLLGEQARRQQNRESVAVAALEILNDGNPQSFSIPSDDWMNVFSQHAENASSDKFRLTWSRIIAGEIRKPGFFSLATLHFVSLLDAETAMLIEKILPWCVDNLYFLASTMKDDITMGELIALEEAGFLTRGNDSLSLKRQPDNDGNVFFQLGNEYVVAVVGNAAPIQVVNVHKLTRAGSQLACIIPTEHNIEIIAKALLTPSIKEILLARRNSDGSDTLEVYGKYTH